MRRTLALISRALFLAVLIHHSTLLLGATLTITTGRTLPPATLGIAYSVALSATGGSAPYTWSVTTPATPLPAGLSLNPSTGLISGVPIGTLSGAVFSITVTDQAEHTVTKVFDIAVSVPPEVSFVYYFPLSWTVGSAYWSQLSVGGGIQPYTWSLIAGSLPNGLSFNTTTAEITGTPTIVGVFTFTIQVADANNTVATKTATVTINPVPMITTGSLPSATIGVAYSAMLSATGGTPPLELFFHSDHPPWLNVSTSGVLSGTPTESGTFNLNFGVDDRAASFSYWDLTLVVNDNGALAILTAPSLPSGTVGVSYSQTFSALHGTTPYSWSVTAGNLPPGLSLGSSGTLNGVPSGTGAFNFTLQVTDNIGHTASKSFAMTIVPAPLKILTTSLPTATIYSPYLFTLTASGGTPPYLWFFNSGLLPGGITLDSDTGVLSGTPTYAAPRILVVGIIDKNQIRASTTLTMQVLSTFALVTPTLPVATLGVPYTYMLGAQGGALPYTWNTASGSFPPGLTVNPANGAISGTPSQSGTYTVTLEVTDNAGGDISESLTFKVSGPSQVSSLICTPSSVSPPGISTCTVTLKSAAPSGLTVNLVADNDSVTLPATIQVASGQAQAAFAVNVSASSTDQTVVITASAGSSKAVFSLFVAGGPLKVNKLACVPETVAAGEKSSCTVTLSKPPSSVLVASLSAAAPILTVPSSIAIDAPQNTGTFQALAGAGVKKQVVMVTASIPGGSGASGTVTVLPTASEQPVIIAPDSVDATVSSPIQFTASASDPLGRPVTLSAANLPQGASFAAGTGVFSWTPNATQTGIFNVTIKGTNSVQLTSSKDVVIRIAAANSSALRFVPIAPCRVADTRNANGLFGGPAILGQNSRDFAIPNSDCSIPSTAKAYSLNITVVPHEALGYLTVWPAGQSRPLAATLSSLDGRIKANAAIVFAGASGAISVFSTDATDVVLDINGYFVSATDPAALAFYPLPPCRVVDTRNSVGPLGAPALPAQSIRSFPIQGVCDVPENAQAYSLNFAVVPKLALGYLTSWPAGQPQPLVASLSAMTGTITANAVILPAGTNGAVDVFATDDTELVIDINGYFAPQGTGGLLLYAVTPCRVLDTRLPSGTPPFIGIRDVNVNASGCAVPSTAQAFVFNASVIPPGSLGYIEMWPRGATQPLVATLSAVDGAIASNMAIVPTTDGSISVFSSSPTHLVLDIVGYFAP